LEGVQCFAERLDWRRRETFARPFIANAQAKTATVLWVQGFVKEEDEAFKNMGAAYEKRQQDRVGRNSRCQLIAQRDMLRCARRWSLSD
jgi:hypothetical protein